MNPAEWTGRNERPLRILRLFTPSRSGVGRARARSRGELRVSEGLGTLLRNESPSACPRGD